MSKLLVALLLTAAPFIAYAGQIAIIIDDIGYNLSLGRRCADLPGQFTLAVLPFTPHGLQLSERAHARGKELILHAPMSNTRDLSPGRGALTSELSQPAFAHRLSAMLREVPHIRGLNNHMGSQLTQEQEPMNWLMDELAQRSLYFIDSRTSADSLALQTAQRYQIPSARRDIFLDNERDPVLIYAQLRKALALARSQGKSIAIGHPYPETLRVLEQIQPLLKEYQVELVSASRLLQASTIDGTEDLLVFRNTYCPAPPVLLWRPLGNNSSASFDSDWLHWQSFSYEDW